MGWNYFGNDWAVELLRQHAQHGKARQAYLLCGPTGIGRRTLALRFAQALNCQQPPEPGGYCGGCRACRKIAEMEHPDLALISAEQTGGEVKIEAIRELQHTLSLSPYEARWRVALLLNFENATEQAQNALLKTLEEAPVKAILCLTADSAENLLPTITSRCEVLRLRPQPIDDIKRFLLERQPLSPEKADLIAHLSQGKAGAAARMADDGDFEEKRGAQLQEFHKLLEGSRFKRLEWVMKLTKTKGNTREEREQVKQDLRDRFVFWQSVWRDVMIAGVDASAELTNPDLQDTILALVGKSSPGRIERLVAKLEKAVNRVTNANLQLLTDTLLLDWPFAA